MMLDHQVLCLPAQDDDEFGGDGGGFVFDSPCKSSEASPLNLDSILSPGKQRSDQQVADEFNAENFPMGLNCRQDLIDEEDDEQRDQQVEAIDLLIESNDDSLSHANAEQNAEALNNIMQTNLQRKTILCWLRTCPTLLAKTTENIMRRKASSHLGVSEWLCL